jgi:hypothetical protein
MNWGSRVTRGSGDNVSTRPSPSPGPVMLCLRQVAHVGFFVYVHPVPHLLIETDAESQTGVPSGHSPGPTLAHPPGVGTYTRRPTRRRHPAGRRIRIHPLPAFVPDTRAAVQAPAKPEPIVPRPGTVTWVPLRRSAAHREAEEPGSIRIHRKSHLLG